MIEKVPCHGRPFSYRDHFGRISYAFGEAHGVSYRVHTTMESFIFITNPIRILAIYTLMTQTATYFRIIHGWDMQWIGWLSGIPHILRMGFAYFLSTWSDSMLRQKKMSLGSVRKLACALCTSIGSIIYIVLAISGCNAWLAAICVALAIMLHGASTTGPLTGFMDISPNYSGITLGVGQAVTVIPGILSPYIVGILTLNNVIHRLMFGSFAWQLTSFLFFARTANGSTMAIRVPHHIRDDDVVRPLLPILWKR